MTITQLYEEILCLALQYDPRSEFKSYSMQEAQELYVDSMIYHNTQRVVKKIAVGIEIDAVEMYYAKMNNYDAIISFMPKGKAYLNIWKAMDIYKFMLLKIGILKSVVDKIICERQIEFELEAMSTNFNKDIEIAKRLEISFANFYTPAELLGNHFVYQALAGYEEEYLTQTIVRLLQIPEFNHISKEGAFPVLIQSSKNSDRLGKYFVRFSGGPSRTQKSETIFKYLKEVGIDTYICKGLPIEHIDAAKEYGINIIVCPSTASNSIGMNLLLDRMYSKTKQLEITALGGFIRIERGRQ